MEGQEVKLSLRHISQSYIINNRAFDAISDVSFDVRDCEFLVILGPGYCGKTVLLNILSGLEEPIEGDVLLDGEEIHGGDKRIGMVDVRLIIGRAYCVIYPTNEIGWIS